jgi:hypothetical protein
MIFYLNRKWCTSLAVNIDGVYFEWDETKYTLGMGKELKSS